MTNNTPNKHNIDYLIATNSSQERADALRSLWNKLVAAGADPDELTQFADEFRNEGYSDGLELGFECGYKTGDNYKGLRD